ncbi:hypothetical protein [Streptomyces sparsogenes]|uniref:hypothetical protein n=1 Tax=Streptomyces sparsogenes TaxID=67365 RepID=UPI001301A7E3|nr:hypothetical protein [Streptomyces sparsogenes]
MDDDELLAQIGNLGAAINASQDPALDPQLQGLAGSAAEHAAGQLSTDSKQE